MVELFNECMFPPNLLFTAFLILVMLYWITVILGAADVDMFDADWMPELDVDDGGVLNAMFQFLGIGEVPVMVIISVMTLSGWCFSMLANHYLNPGQSLAMGAGLLVPVLIACFFITSFVLRPLRKLFAPIHEKDKNEQKIIYSVGTVLTSQVNEDFGQVEIRTKAAPITINARTTEGAVFKKGETVLVYDEDKEKGIYFVEKFEE